MGRPTFFSMLIIIIAHIPIFTLQRHEGRIFAPMAYTITSALIGSLLFSLDAGAGPVRLPAATRRRRRKRTSSFASRNASTGAVLTPALSRPEDSAAGSRWWPSSRR